MKHPCLVAAPGHVARLLTKSQGADIHQALLLCMLGDMLGCP
jgi:hypothetical protein